MNVYKTILGVALVLSMGHIAASDFVGELPEKVIWLARLIQDNNRFLNFAHASTLPPTLGRLILHGPPGNGKSTIAVKIAELGEAQLFKIHGPSIVGRYVGQGAETIEAVFNAARDYADEHQRVAVIVIDEVDAIAGSNTTEFRSEHSAALQKLWLLLDDYKEDPRIFVICTTNSLEQLHQAFLDRFGSNCIEIGYPDAIKRQQVLQHYFNLYAKKPIDDALIRTVVKKTEGMSIRCLEDLARDASLAAYMQNDSYIKPSVVMNTFYEIEKKWKSHNKNKSTNPFESWHSMFAACNDLTLTIRNLCFIYGLYKTGSVVYPYI